MVVQISPNGIQKTGVNACIVCSDAVRLRRASIGAVGAGGQPAFACNAHLTEHARRARWIVSWVDFTAIEVPILPMRETRR